MEQPPGAGIRRGGVRLPPPALALLAAAALGGACGPRPATSEAPRRGQDRDTEASIPPELPPDDATPRAPVANAAPGSAWAAVVRSPRPAPAGDPALEDWSTRCGEGDSALHEVALAVATHRERQGAPPDLEWTTYRLRQHGAPYVAPRVWSAELPVSDDVQRVEVAGRIEQWARRPARGVLRCGIAEVTRDDGSSVVAIVQVDAQGDLAELPTRVAPGRWLDVRTRPLVAATDVTGLVLGPQGSPRPIALSQVGDEWRGRFAVDRPGPWVLQLLANHEGGALPILEAHLHAGDGPVVEPWRIAAPGETAREGGMTEEDALLVMLNEARRLTGLPPLTPSPALAVLARRHSSALRARGAISHDAGSGNPTRRVEEAGITARQVGENVARAPSVLRIYRALWASPSHRANLLFPHFDKVGIGVSWEESGMMYVSLLFVDDG